VKKISKDVNAAIVEVKGNSVISEFKSMSDVFCSTAILNVLIIQIIRDL